MATRKKDSPLKGLIKESLSELKGEQFPEDPELNGNEITGPERFAHTQKKRDEIVIDSLLSSINGKTGYFLKLKKEMRPNEWMLMKTVESEWRNWADVETEVANIVKEHTKKSPAKWGTGAYRIEIACKGGMRGQTYDSIDVYVNAEEEFLTLPGQTSQSQVIDPSVQVTSTLDMISQLMNAVKGVIPTPPNPAETQQQIASAFQQGMQLKVGDSNNNSQMLIAMMTMMMTSMKEIMAANRVNTATVVNPQDDLKGMLETLKTFGVLGNTNQIQQQKTVVDLAKELKELGIDLFKKDDPLEQVNKLKQIAGIAAQFMGMGNENVERPSILEKIVDVVGPSIPGMIKDVRETMDNAVKAQQIAGQNIERATKVNESRQIPSGGGTTYQQMANSGGSVNPESTVNSQIQAFFNQLYEAVKTNNRMFYPVIYTSLLQDEKGQQLLQGIVNGTKSAKDLIDVLQEYGGDRFKDSEFVMKYMVGYTNGFIVWIRSMMNVQSEQTEQATHVPVTNGYDVECPVCHTVYQYESEQDFNSEQNKSCGANIDGKACQGLMKPLAKAS